MTIPQPPMGARWALLGKISAAELAEHAATSAEWHGGDVGPPCAPHVGCCVLSPAAAGETDAVQGAGCAAARGAGPARTFGGRGLYLVPAAGGYDVFAAVPRGRPSAFVGELSLPLVGAFALTCVDNGDVLDIWERDVHRVHLVGTMGEVPARRIAGDPALQAAIRAAGYPDPMRFAGGRAVAVTVAAGRDV